MNNPPLINHFPKQSKWRQWLQHGSTAIIWVLYASLWVPVITAVAWFVGLRTFYQTVWIKEPLEDMFVLITLPVIALVCGLLLVGWAEYNRRRFVNADQRQRRLSVSEQQVVIGLNATPELAKTLRNARISYVATDEQANPITVIVKS